MIWTNWDPLEEVIVGNCTTSSNVADSKVKSLLDLILTETKEDLDNLAEYLTKMGIKVHRPKIVDFKETDFAEFKIFNPTQPIVPRDQYLAYGNTIYQTYTSMPDRYLDSYAFYDIFLEMFDQGYNWLSQPPPMIKNFNDTETWFLDSDHIYNSELSRKILWHTATMFKCGDTLITNTNGPGSQLGLEWMRRNCSAKIISNPNTYSKNFGHIDHGFYMSDDETVICVNNTWLPEVLKNKRIIDLSGLTEQFDYKTFISEEKNKHSLVWLEKWLSEWRGYSQTTAFESNVLVVDPNNIIFSIEQPKVFKVLEKNGINCHVCSMRHGLFWDAGIHCATLDLKRRGKNRSII